MTRIQVKAKHYFQPIKLWIWFDFCSNPFQWLENLRIKQKYVINESWMFHLQIFMQWKINLSELDLPRTRIGSRPGNPGLDHFRIGGPKPWVPFWKTYRQDAFAPLQYTYLFVAFSLFWYFGSSGKILDFWDSKNYRL